MYEEWGPRGGPSEPRRRTPLPPFGPALLSAAPLTPPNTPESLKPQRHLHLNYLSILRPNDLSVSSLEAQNSHWIFPNLCPMACDPYPS